jgi:periplasmic copper chaperone A
MLFEKPKTARIFVYAALLGGLLAAPVRAEEVKVGDLVITQEWSRATPGGAKIATGYLTIENKGSTPDRLIGGSADVAGKVEVHEMATKNGVMTMRPLDNGLTIEPGKTVKLAPGGYHLMLLDLKSPLKQGDEVPVRLEFEKAGEVRLSFDVQGVGAQGPGVSSKPETGSPGKMDMKNMPGRAAFLPSLPVHAQSDDESFFTHLHTEKAMANVTILPGRAGPVDIMIQLETTDERPLTARAVSVTLTNTQSGIAPQTAQALPTGDDQWLVKMSAPAAGRWMLALGITLLDLDQVSVESPVLIK